MSTQTGCIWERSLLTNTVYHFHHSNDFGLFPLTDTEMVHTETQIVSPLRDDKNWRENICYMKQRPWWMILLGLVILSAKRVSCGLIQVPVKYKSSESLLVWKVSAKTQRLETWIMLHRLSQGQDHGRARPGLTSLRQNPKSYKFQFNQILNNTE